MSEIQSFGTIAPAFIGLGENVRAESVEALNQTLADTITAGFQAFVEPSRTTTLAPSAMRP
jgi:hypothetical protein